MSIYLLDRAVGISLVTELIRITTYRLFLSRILPSIYDYLA
jgi:hypothetical protein